MRHPKEPHFPVHTGHGCRFACRSFEFDVAGKLCGHSHLHQCVPLFAWCCFLRILCEQGLGGGCHTGCFWDSNFLSCIGVSANELWEQLGEMFFDFCEESGYDKIVKVLGKTLRDFLQVRDTQMCPVVARRSLRLGICGLHHLLAVSLAVPQSGLVCVSGIWTFHQISGTVIGFSGLRVV